MELIAAYLVVVVVFQGLFAFRAPNQDAPIVFMLCLIWPVSFVLLGLISALSWAGWEINIASGTKRYGFRQSPQSDVRGFAVTVFGLEIQIYGLLK